MTGHPLTTEEIFARIEKVSASDVQGIARELFRPQGLNLAIVGPHRDSDALTRLIDDFP